MRKMNETESPRIGYWMKSDWPLRLTPVRLVVFLAVIIFVAEFSVMLILALLPPLSSGTEALIDSTILLLLLSPTYFSLFLPLKRYYHEHLRADEEVRFLTRRMLTVVEDEKKRIARDLHDASGQTIAALQYKVGALSSTLPPEISQERKELFGSVDQLVHQLSDQVRSLMGQLRPQMLEHFGIVETLEWYLTELGEQRRDLSFSFHHNGSSERYSAETEIALFRTCQEALNNALLHSGANRIEVHLERNETSVRLTICDDGCGFDPLLARQRKRRLDGIGLLGMRERIESLNGKLTIDSAPGRGTSILAEIPVL